jgi:hypothetical protein
MNINDLPPEIAALARKYATTNSEYLQKAFTWDDTPGGYAFWEQINVGNYEPFYARYGRPAEEWVPKVGEGVLVSDDGYEQEETKIFLCKFGNYYVCASENVGYPLPKGRFGCYVWPYCKPIPTPRRITRAEIAKAMNIEGEFEIID